MKELKLKRIRNLINSIFDKAVDYKINMDLWEHQQKRLRKIYLEIAYK